MVKVAKEKLPEAEWKHFEKEMARVEQRAGIKVKEHFKYFNDGPKPVIQYSDKNNLICIGELGPDN